MPSNISDLFEEFLRRVLSTKKVNSAAAFDLGRDARFQAIETILINKNICTKQELEEVQREVFDKIASAIEKMPPLPKE